MVGDSDLARDVVQEAFARAVRKRGSMNHLVSVESWLWAILANAARDQNRRRRRLRASFDRLGYSSNGYGIAADRADVVREAETVRRGLLELPERQRTMLFLHYYAGLDYSGIARVLEVAPGTVGATLNAARTSLRRRLQEER
jgi:RNA polymerase sigma-70 factor (ECF subfamily)